MEDDVLCITDRPQELPDVPETAHALVLSPGEVTESEWVRATLIVVDDAGIDELAPRDLPAHENIVVIGTDLDDAGIYPRAEALGAHAVHVLPQDESRLVTDMAAAIHAGTTIIAVTGGCGGAGASTMAAAIAQEASRTGRDTLLLDADPMGGGITDRIDFSAPTNTPGGFAPLAILSFERDEETVLPPGSVADLLTTALPDYQVIVVDCPRHPDAAAIEALHRADTTLVVTPISPRALAGTRRVLHWISRFTSQTRLITTNPTSENMAGTAFADQLATPLAAEHHDDIHATARTLITRLCTRGR